MQNDIKSLLALAMIPRLGPVTARNLIAYCGGAKAVLEAPERELIRVPGIGAKTVQAIKGSKTSEAADKELIFCEKNGVATISCFDKAYPKSLAHIHDSPLVLFQKGALDFNAQPNIAIVGTRNATAYGKEITTRFAGFFARQGINVVSGLAYGIDITAHRAALAEEGLTTAVLGHGLDQVYPASHARKAREIVKSGSLLSEFPSKTAIDPGNFPARNRLISGLSKAVIVIEAAASGGALITAKFAFDQNREVFAIPGRLGDPYSEGCNRLIRDNIAKLVSTPEEVLEELEIRWQEAAEREGPEAPSLPDLELTEEEVRVLAFLNRGEALIDSIAMQTSIPIARLNSLLISMEFRSLVRQLPGKKYRKL